MCIKSSSFVGSPYSPFCRLRESFYRNIREPFRLKIQNKQFPLACKVHRVHVFWLPKVPPNLTPFWETTFLSSLLLIEFWNILLYFNLSYDSTNPLEIILHFDICRFVGSFPYSISLFWKGKVVFGLLPFSSFCFVSFLSYV